MRISSMKFYYLHIIYIYRMMDEFEKVCNGAGPVDFSVTGIHMGSTRREFENTTMITLNMQEQFFNKTPKYLQYAA